MKLVKFTEKLAKKYVSWKYITPYDIYNLPTWEEMKQKEYKATTQKGRKNYFAYVEDDAFLGVVSFKETSDNIYIGIAISPNLCGKGLGAKVLAQALKDFDKKNNRTKPFYSEVRSWNQRSIKTFQKCGFVVLETKKCKGKDGDFEGVCLQQK